MVRGVASSLALRFLKESATEDLEGTAPENQLAARWTGPFDVLLTTHSSVRLAGVKPWVHHSGIEVAPIPQESTPLDRQVDWPLDWQPGKTMLRSASPRLWHPRPVSQTAGSAIPSPLPILDMGPFGAASKVVLDNRTALDYLMLNKAVYAWRLSPPAAPASILLKWKPAFIKYGNEPLDTCHCRPLNPFSLGSRNVTTSGKKMLCWYPSLVTGERDDMVSQGLPQQMVDIPRPLPPF
ncbi:uncharacterized protein [Equus przewalskii]|uniref:Uncharacterized protein isoform X1 n=1 Tax=Equus przewalskii TaxID=9798 RepID=A0ABM4LI52_EQUPR